MTEPLTDEIIEKMWKHNKKGQSFWFNEGKWVTDGPPEFYCPMPRFNAAAVKRKIT